MNELQEWQAVLAAAQAQGRQDLVARAQAEIARLTQSAEPAMPSTQTPGQAFAEGAVGAVKAPFQAAAGLMKADLGELPGKALEMGKGVVQGIPELLRRALGPGAEETRDPAMFMGKGGVRATMPPSVSPQERAGAVGALSVAGAAPFAARVAGSPTVGAVGKGLSAEMSGALEAVERALMPRRAFYRTAERARRTGQGASPSAVLDEAAITGAPAASAEEAMVAKALGVPVEMVRGRVGQNAMAPARPAPTPPSSLRQESAVGYSAEGGPMPPVPTQPSLAEIVRPPVPPMRPEASPGYRMQHRPGVPETPEAGRTQLAQMMERAGVRPAPRAAQAALPQSLEEFSDTQLQTLLRAAESGDPAFTLSPTEFSALRDALVQRGLLPPIPGVVP